MQAQTAGKKMAEDRKLPTPITTAIWTLVGGLVTFGSAIATIQSLIAPSIIQDARAGVVETAREGMVSEVQMYRHTDARLKEVRTENNSRLEELEDRFKRNTEQVRRFTETTIVLQTELKSQNEKMDSLLGRFDSFEKYLMNGREGR